MSYKVDIVVHSDRPKEVPDRVLVVVGLPTEDSFSLPFAHKQLFAEQKDRYDLFIYSEDDILIQEDNVAAFLDVTKVLPSHEITGFFRYEMDEKRKVIYVDAHPPFGWDPHSVCTIDGYTFASFSNLHSGCYALTRQHLQKAIRSGGYLVPPHQTWYETRESAATDPYTQCGFTKRICISHLDNFLVHHLPNNYVGVLGTEQDTFQKLLDSLSRCRP
jgi:hypothetical protein